MKQTSEIEETTVNVVFKYLFRDQKPAVYRGVGGPRNHYTANEGLVRIQYKCLVPIYVFPEMKLCSLLIS
jgi:hypothetical protein